MPTLKPDDLTNKLLTAFFDDVGNMLQVRTKDLKADLSTMLRRKNSEGFGFVAKTMPTFAKALERALAEGHWTPISAFRRQRSGVLPCFLQGLTSNVFDTNGALLDSPCTLSIRLIRQICYMFYKTDLGEPIDLQGEIIEDFVKTDESLYHNDVLEPERAAAINTAQDIIANLFGRFDTRDIIPRPGPGQTADRCPHHLRYEPNVQYRTIEDVYSSIEYNYLSTRHLEDRQREISTLPQVTEGVARLTAVPKDSRGPRLICMIPHVYMWYQQGLGRRMMERMDSHWLTSGRVNFHDQTVNARLALQSSLDGQYGTLDMKEASDRISRSLVDLLFHTVPDLRDKLLALSTRMIELPDGTIFSMRKFAPMGSALCFPVMSIVHFALCVAAISVNTGRSIRYARKHVYVYGDDLIISSKYVECVMDTLEEYGLVFNRMKSFWTGQFRESCGTDAYAGVDVTPVRFKRIVFSVKSGADLASATSYYNNLVKKDYCNMASVLKEHITSIYGNLPYVSANSGIPGYHVDRTDVPDCNAFWHRTHNNPKKGWKWNQRLQSPYLRVRVLKAPINASMIGWEGVVRSLVHAEQGATNLYRRSDTKIKWKNVPLSCV